jgi:hypothetical protein
VAKPLSACYEEKSKSQLYLPTDLNPIINNEYLVQEDESEEIHVGSWRLWFGSWIGAGGWKKIVYRRTKNESKGSVIVMGVNFMVLE